MLKHIVMFRFTEETEKKRKIELAKKLAIIFSPLESLKCVSEFTTGINFNEASHAWDFVIDSVFENREALKAYQISKEHQEAIKSASHIPKEKAVADFQF